MADKLWLSMMEEIIGLIIGLDIVIKERPVGDKIE